MLNQIRSCSKRYKDFLPHCGVGGRDTVGVAGWGGVGSQASSSGLQSLPVPSLTTSPNTPLQPSSLLRALEHTIPQGLCTHCSLCLERWSSRYPHSSPFTDSRTLHKCHIREASCVHRHKAVFSHLAYPPTVTAPGT